MSSVFQVTEPGAIFCQYENVDNLAYVAERIHAAYRHLESSLSSLDCQAYLAILSQDHETIQPDERRVSRAELERASFPFDGLRNIRTCHHDLRLRQAPSSCTVLLERYSTMTLGNRSFEETLTLHDFWKLESESWKLRRRIILRRARKAPGHFSLVEHPLYCQFGDCRTDKSTWQEGERREVDSSDGTLRMYSPGMPDAD